MSKEMGDGGRFGIFLDSTVNTYEARLIYFCMKVYTFHQIAFINL